MKVASTITETPANGLFQLPQGLVGFPRHKSFEIFYKPEELPFCWLRLNGPEPLHFVVVDPTGVIPDYEPELFDEDAAALGIVDSAQAAIFNIVTVNNSTPPSATANLVGPIIINRGTGVARQVVLANYTRFSAHHPLVISA